jgi:hypothetical protein
MLLHSRQRLAVGAIVYGAKTWRGVKEREENSPYRILTKLQKLTESKEATITFIAP